VKAAGRRWRWLTDDMNEDRESYKDSVSADIDKKACIQSQRSTTTTNVDEVCNLPMTLDKR